ncbi:MAG: hypothetical protein MUO24_02435 [Desulfobacterales bacterium]|nr:hypothetical protein [Desulfobacterales bacterium]
MIENENKIVKVEILEPALSAHYGPTMRIALRQALLGEKKGKWRIVREGEASQVYETRVMEPGRPSAMGVEDMFSKAPSPKRIKKKRVAWVQDLSRLGGAEISSQEVVRVGGDCGFDVATVTPQTDYPQAVKTLFESDVIILNNIWQFSPEMIRKILEAVFSERVPYVKYEHDHRELGRPEFSRRLFQNSAFNVFLSPMHLERHRKALGCEGICLPLAIDPRPFLSVSKGERIPNSALISNCRNFKLWTNLQAYINENPGFSFSVLTDKDPAVGGHNVEAIPMVAYEKMPGVYSSFEYLVHILDGWGAGERVVFEAALAGCKIVANDHVGHMSWGRDLTDAVGLAGWLTEAPYKFWQEVEKIVG